jgi:hypothetical protein
MDRDAGREHERPASVRVDGVRLSRPGAPHAKTTDANSAATSQAPLCTQRGRNVRTID